MIWRWVVDRIKMERARRLFCGECGAPMTDVEHATCSVECADSLMERTAI